MEAELEIDESKLANPLISLGRILWRHNAHVWPFLKSQKYRSKKLRVSMAAIVRIKIDGKYLLVRNRHRQGCFGPLGGVLKHYESANSFLEKIEFSPEEKAGIDADLKDDLRGFIFGARFGDFLLWFESQMDREIGIDALRRELREESREAQFDLTVEDKLFSLSFQRLRSVNEGPCVPASVSYPQYRNIEVFAPREDDKFREFVEAMKSPTNAESRHFCLVTKQEIDRGRIGAGYGEFIDGMEILPNVSYLFFSREQKNESAPI